jgi:TRAP-type mannitol/chloroaromatic compound transport system permease small subunit
LARLRPWIFPADDGNDGRDGKEERLNSGANTQPERGSALKMPRFIKYIDETSKWTGRVVSWLMLALVLELVYDTIARYAFNKPTVWSFDVSYMLSAVLFMIGGAHTMLVDGHVRVDVLYERFSKKKRALIEMVFSLVYFFPAIGSMVVFGFLFAEESWRMNEHAMVSYWSPPLYHFKTVIPIAAFLLFFQGVSEFVRRIAVLTSKGKEI